MCVRTCKFVHVFSVCVFMCAFLHVCVWILNETGLLEVREHLHVLYLQGSAHTGRVWSGQPPQTIE